ncbi:MAG: DUF4129 domain-containing protein, partial [Candidatus Saliniplasma sp.]
YEYITELYNPYYIITENLTTFVERHRAFLHNMTKAGDQIRPLLDDGGVISWEGMESINNASLHLRKMEGSLDGMYAGLDNVDRQIFEVENVSVRLDDASLLIDKYRELLDELTYEYRGIETYLSIFVPAHSYPGKEIEVEGFYIEEGEYQSNYEVKIYKDGDLLGDTHTEEDGHYSLNYDIPWEHPLGEVEFYAELAEKEVSSDNVTLVIRKYSSHIELKLTKRTFYNESITVNGTFSTEPEMDIDGQMLNASMNKTASTDHIGHFQLIYESKEFDWGENWIEVSYLGSRIIESSSASISVERSIPTHLSIETGKNRYEIDEILTISGYLTNSSSMEGLENETVVLIIDRDNYEEIKTVEIGYYEYQLELSQLEEGTFTFYSVYNGSEKYRECRSRNINIHVDEDEVVIGNGDGNGDPEPFVKNRIILLIIFVVLCGYFFTYYLYRRREGTEESISQEEKREKPSVAKKEKITVKASSTGDIPSAYRRFLDVLQSEDVISVPRGKTHREISSELTRSTGLKDEIERLTQIFEKAYFSSKKITEYEIETFNAVLDGILREMVR